MGRFDGVDAGAIARAKQEAANLRDAAKEVQIVWANATGAEILHEFAAAAEGKVATVSVIAGAGLSGEPIMREAILLASKHLGDGYHESFYIDATGDFAIRPGHLRRNRWNPSDPGVAEGALTYPVAALILGWHPGIGLAEGESAFDEQAAESWLTQALAARLERG